ncbi:glucosaminidase domain-containing protein [Pontimicrobium aquaticum]|uniref:Mannosyl-glycoprotein endo-beta-N-acetylglucosamidase-like domain-containing protein n=1 Tax=Pontimicrobium aquaticum TaxID=2565367 RepID=A0A4U0ESS2_9FLAO|nr:glucosaminidase domain-containing protein [Pontimicrobium aquaticum]TJY33382.1 hypothetical protein E5167_12845 [Pontimicrobium aquaticum]
MLFRLKIWLYIWLLKNLYGYTKVSVKLLFAQSWHETGNFKSEVFKQNNNLFGMRHPKVRKTYSKGSNLSHAVFKSHFDSVRDYFERQKNFGISNTGDTNYSLETVASNYATDPNYLQKWQNVKKTIKAPTNNMFLLGGLFFLVLLTVLIYKRTKKF